MSARWHVRIHSKSTVDCLDVEMVAIEMGNIRIFGQ